MLITGLLVLIGGGIVLFKYADNRYNEHLARKSRLPWWREPDDNFGSKS